MSTQDIIAELSKLTAKEREMLVRLNEEFEPTAAMEEAISEGLCSLKESKTYSALEIRSRVAAWTAR